MTTSGDQDSRAGPGPGTTVVRPETLKYSAEAGGEASDNTDTERSGDLSYRNHYYWRNQGLSNVSSVEEAEDILNESTKIKSNSDASNEAKSKSPKYLPKFLRTSFSKLISKDKSKSLSSQEPASSLPFFSSVSIPSLSSPTPSMCHTDSDNNDNVEEPRPCSPATQQFVEDSLAKVQILVNRKIILKIRFLFVDRCHLILLSWLVKHYLMD